MQDLVNVVRSTGATNIIMLGGLEYSNSLSQWLTFKPTDPTGNLAASWHSYNFNLCNNQQCWDTYVAPVAAQVPLIVGEIGENDCNYDYIDPLMQWLDELGAHYLGWTWNTWEYVSYCIGDSIGCSIAILYTLFMNSVYSIDRISNRISFIFC
jgi:hypothetical protein